MMAEAVRQKTSTGTGDGAEPGAVRVLVVGPDPDAHDAIRATLQDAGYQVDRVTDASKAMDAIADRPPDVLVVDRVADHHDLLRIKSDPTTCDIPIILVVAANERSETRAELEAGVDEILAEPLCSRELLARVRSMSRLRQNRLELGQSRGLHGEQTRMWIVLVDFARAVPRITVLDALLERIVTAAAEMTSSRRISLMLPDEKQEYLTIAKAIGLDEELADNTRVPVGQAISGQAFRSGRPVTSLQDRPSSTKHHRYDFKSFVSMPMTYTTLSMVHQRVGVLNISNRYGDRPFEEWELEFVDLLGSIAGSAIDEIHSRRARESLLRIERDLQLARQIQRNTFPDQLPILSGFEIDAWSEPAEETGGDTYDVVGYQRAGDGPILLSENHADRALLLLADATGPSGWAATRWNWPAGWGNVRWN